MIASTPKHFYFGTLSETSSRSVRFAARIVRWYESLLVEIERSPCLKLFLFFAVVKSLPLPSTWMFVASSLRTHLPTIGIIHKLFQIPVKRVVTDTIDWVTKNVDIPQFLVVHFSFFWMDNYRTITSSFKIHDGWTRVLHRAVDTWKNPLNHYVYDASSMFYFLDGCDFTAHFSTTARAAVVFPTAWVKENPAIERKWLHNLQYVFRWHRAKPFKIDLIWLTWTLR